MAYFHILGTGPSTPITDAVGRNYRRRTSALMQHIATYILVDATHDFDEQIERAMSVTAVTLTNGSRDAAGGLGNLDRFAEHNIELCVPQDLYDEVLKRYGPFEFLIHRPLVVHEPTKVGDITMTAFPVETSSGADKRPTYGYRFTNGKKTVTYVSDIKRLPEESEVYFRDNDLLVVDAAGWDKDLPTHRGALNHVHTYASGDNQQILFTHLGRSAPPHAQASAAVRRMAHNADVAFDFMKLPLGR